MFVSIYHNLHLAFAIETLASCLYEVVYIGIYYIGIVFAFSVNYF